MVIARRKRRVCGGVHRGASSLRWASRTLRSHPLREKEVRLPLAHRFRSARISSRHAPWHGELARGISASRSPPSRPLESPRGRGVAPRTEGVKRRLALVRNAAPPWPALRSGRSLHREGPPVHHADRRAFRRFTAAILGFGTVLPGPDGEHFARPDPGGFGLRSSGPRPARQGAVPRSWDGRWTRSLPGICLRGTSAGAAPRSAFRTPPEGALGE
jgi:hypothetical protein